MQYIGLQTQIWRNNLKSTLLLIAFPALLLGLTWLFFFLSYGSENINEAHSNFFQTAPWISLGVLTWFCIAYFSHTSIIKKATQSKSLDRKTNMKIYNLVENLCISQGMKTPKIYIIEDDSLNAFASGINENTYSVSLSRGIINKLNEEELEAVIAHELTHIQNRDVRLLIISIIFVGIFAFIAEVALRSIGRSSGSNKKDGRVMVLIFLLAAAGYILSLVFRFALSRKREFLADAGSAQMTKKPEALANALEKISQDARIEAVKRRDVAQLFIESPQEKSAGIFSSLSSIFATHPPIKERISVLQNF